MTSIHLFQAEKKDFQDVYDLLIQFKHDDLEHLDLPKVDQKKLIILVQQRNVYEYTSYLHQKEF